MSTRTLWKIKLDVHQVYNLRLPDSNELPDPYIAASLELPRTSKDTFPVQRTAAKSKTSSGTFNSVMLFIANIYDFDFDKVKILIRVHNGKKIRELLDSDGLLIGTTSFSLPMVYSQPKHWIPREWLPITSPTSPGDCRGYVQVSIGVFGPGDDVPTQLSDFQLTQDSAGGKDVISRSILEKIVLTPETNFHNCMLVVNILRAENLPVLSAASSFGNGGSRVVPSSGYVRVSFVGVHMTSRVIPSNANPAWNESIRIPVLCPSWDKNVIVEVFSKAAGAAASGKRARQGMPEETSTESDLLLGTAISDFDMLFKAGMPPTWFNLYSSAAARNPSFAALFGSDYSGRIQVAGSVARSSDLNASVVPFDASSTIDPATEEIVLFIDIYELAFLDDAIQREEIPKELWLQVQFGPNTFESDHVLDASMTCIFNDSLGRLDPIRVHLPVDRSMAYDMVLSVCGLAEEGTTYKLCYARLPLDRFLVSSTGSSVVAADPEWVRLNTIKSESVSVVTNLVSDISSLWGSVVGGGAKANIEREERDNDRICPVANVLTNITAFRLGKGQFPNRPDRIPYTIGTYELRFSCHQACNIPIADPASGVLSSGYCRVTLAGVSSKSGVIPYTLYPVWNEGLRIEVDLPQNPTLRPDVLIEVIDKDTETVLGFATMKTNTLRPQWTGSPTWYRLHNPNKMSLGVEQESFVLCSAVLVPGEEKDNYPIPSPLPQRGTFTVDLLIVGVRLIRNYNIERLSKLEVCWGRHRDNPKRRVVSIKTNDPVSGEGGQFNYLQPALLDLDLPIDSTYQEFLEIRLLEQADVMAETGAENPAGGSQGTSAGGDWWASMTGGGHQGTSMTKLKRSQSLADGVDKPIGYGFLHLNPHYSWINDTERVQYRDLFRLKSHEELRRIEEAKNAELASLDRKDKDTGYYRNESDKVRKRRRNKGWQGSKRRANKDEVELEYIETEIDAYFGIDMEQNYKELPMQYFNSVESDSLFPSRFRATKKKENPNARRNAVQSRKYKSLQEGAAAFTENAEKKPLSRFMEEFVWEPTVSKQKAENVRREIDGELEPELDPERLPFISIPLVTGSATGSESFVIVGYLKVRCRVREKSEDSSALLALQQAFIEQFEACTRLMCRLYVLRAEGIVPSQAADSKDNAVAQSEATSYYLWIRNVCGDLIAEYPNCSIKDDGSIANESGSTNPEFNKCFQLPCSFPENSVLYIELYEKRASLLSTTAAAVVGLGSNEPGSSDILLGQAMIDIESRWFHPHYQGMINSGSGRSEVPIETWTLRSPDSAGIPKGKMRMWLELMDQVTSMGRPIESLPSPQPENQQVRIVLWRTRGVPHPEGEEQSHQAVAVFMQNMDSQCSDTHYGSLDGSGTFNWRYVMNPIVPTEDSTIRFQLLHKPLVGISNVAIGEVTIDLAHEMGSVRRTRRGIDLPRCWVPLSHPAFIGKARGSIEIQIRILTSEEARSFPVGVGREAPNTDPFLDGDDPHLVQHRNALANTSVGRSLAKFVDAMQRGVRLATILFILGSVISGIVGLVVLLVSMGVIKFE